MKKILAIIVAAILVATLSFGVSMMVSAIDTDPAIVVSSATTNKGGTVDVKISLKNNPGIASLNLKVKFSNDLSLVSSGKDTNSGMYIVAAPQKNGGPGYEGPEFKFFDEKGNLITEPTTVTNWVKYDVVDIKGYACQPEAGNGALREMVFTPKSPVDMSGRTKIEWDMCAFMSGSPYTESFEKLKTAYASTMKLTVSDGTKTADIPVSEWEIGELQTGGRWRTFGASLAGRGLNLKNIVSFQWVVVPTGMGTNTSIAEMFYRFDNVKALEDTSSSGGEGGEIGPSETIVLSDGSDAATRWTYRGSAATPNTDNGNPGACVHAKAGTTSFKNIPEENKTSLTLNWYSPTENVTGDFTFATLKFKVADDAELGNKDITVTYDAEDVHNSDESNVAFEVQNGKITVTDVIKGDVDGSGVVDSDDAIYLLYHTFYEEDFPVNQEVDFDGSGEVDSDDAIYLLYYTFYEEDFPLH